MYMTISTLLLDLTVLYYSFWHEKFKGELNSKADVKVLPLVGSTWITGIVMWSPSKAGGVALWLEWKEVKKEEHLALGIKVGGFNTFLQVILESFKEDTRRLFDGMWRSFGYINKWKNVKRGWDLALSGGTMLHSLLSIKKSGYWMLGISIQSYWLGVFAKWLPKA